MGASISTASGIVRVLDEQERQRVVAVIGDSTFLHTGVNSLMEMAYNKSPATVLLLDNRITAMTGRQDNPASGWTLAEDPANAIDLVQLCKALGIRHIRVIDPLNLEETRQALQEEMARPEPSVIVTNRPCVLVKREGVFIKGELLAVDLELCTGCRACLKLGCPAIEWRSAEGAKGKAYIDPLLCTGCDVCRQLCKFEAIKKREG